MKIYPPESGFILGEFKAGKSMRALSTLALAVALFQQPSARIEGTVADATTGTPVWDAQVLLAVGSEAKTRAVLTDAFGRLSRGRIYDSDRRPVKNVEVRLLHDGHDASGVELLRPLIPGSGCCLAGRENG
jgi:hypothetical protein